MANEEESLNLNISSNSMSSEENFQTSTDLSVTSPQDQISEKHITDSNALTTVGSSCDSENVLTLNIDKDSNDLQECANIQNHKIVDVNTETSVSNIPSQVHVIPDGSVTSVAGSNGTIYLLVSNDSVNVMQSFGSGNHGAVNEISAGSLKTISSSYNVGSTVQIVNSDGVTINLNVNDILSTISDSKDSTVSSTTMQNPTTGNLLNLSSSILSTTEPGQTLENISDKKVTSNHGYAVSNDTLTQFSMPNWALHLKDCTLFGDTYTGYVSDEVEMDAVINLYKKETMSLFAIRQTPSPAKDEATETVRLMWKSQYVPYDGIPFLNVGRRATVMECEHGPRKRSNAMKRMMQMHGRKAPGCKFSNLTCPARLFVKKVRKFPQYSVPLDADAKTVRLLQEQSLKLVRQAGLKAGEIRLYMQLPLPTAHRYHNIGSTMDLFSRELEETHDGILSESIAVDGRVLEKIRELVRQGFVNPFIVRAAMKDFVENKMKINVQETRPYKHNKAFYPPLIEIQNIIQQTEAALNSGVLSPLPPPPVPPVLPRHKRRRATSFGTSQSPIVIKRIKVDASQAVDAAVDINTTIVSSESMPVSPKNDTSTLSDSTETISLTLTDNQLENFSVQNFTYDQLAQLAKIGLLALNNAAKDVPSETSGENSAFNTHSTSQLPSIAGAAGNTANSLLLSNQTGNETENIFEN